MAKLLIVDDEPEIRAVFGKYFSFAGHDVLMASTGLEAVSLVKSECPAVMLLDVFLPDISGFEVLERTRAQRPVVIMITGHGDIPAAVTAMRGGAETFLTKPVELAHLAAVVDRAIEKAQLIDVQQATTSRIARAAAGMLLGSSAPMRELVEQIEMLARSDRTVALLVGERGVGKARVARAIHALSGRATRPFHEATSAFALGETLSAELFGIHSTPDRAAPGLFEAADGGTLFLDDIAELPLPVQRTLASVLRSHRVRRTSGTRDIPVDVRFIASTVQDLATEVTEERFDEDLYYQLGVMPLYLPPLRARAPEDLRDTVAALVTDLRRGLAAAPARMSDEALTLMLQYPWPGNIREMRNVIERALILGRGETEICVEHLASEVRGLTDESALPHQSRTLAEMERSHIERTLRSHNGNRTRAARELDISRATLIKKIREYELDGRLSLALALAGDEEGT